MPEQERASLTMTEFRMMLLRCVMATFFEQIALCRRCERSTKPWQAYGLVMQTVSTKSWQQRVWQADSN